LSSDKLQPISLPRCAGPDGTRPGNRIVTDSVEEH
jgi:hypothetical protein